MRYLTASIAAWCVGGACCLAAAVTAAAEPVDFDRDIRPLLSDRCYTCHGPDKSQRQTDLRLDTPEGATADLGGYRAIVPGDLESSELFQRIAADDDSRMPPPDSGRRLTAEQIELVRRWIEEGASWRQHWSLVPPQRPPLPAVKNKNWPKNEIDSFILARLEREGLEPSPESSKETLLRRVTLDLTGLPPTLEELDEFLADSSPEAYERAVDRLLASPRYGERMVLEWLDAARYSDTNGYQTDGTRAMWPWRDWVVDALNRNMPFDQFTVEQLAGDMLPDATVEQKIASGFNRNHMLNGEGGRIAEESRVDYVVDRVDTTATVWLGLTAGCARCHDHKYDPISQVEFYRLYAYFNNVAESGAVDRRSSTAAPTIDLPTPEQEARQEELNRTIAQAHRELKALETKLIESQPEWERQAIETIEQVEKNSELPEAIAQLLKTPAGQRNAEQARQVTDYYLSQSPEHASWKEKRDEAGKDLERLKNSVLITMVMEERPEPRDTFLLVRGQYDQYGEKVEPGIPDCLPPLPEAAPNNRLGFAQWIVDRSNPLTARVTVNRYWQTFFGRGLVATTEDFGLQGERPSHPELLDWLAVEFLRDWDVKAMHKRMVMSAAYRQSSAVRDELLDRDPENRLLARGPRFRLNSLTLRDQALALGGLLVERIGGPPVRPYQTPGIWEDFSFGKIKYQQDHGDDLYRRSLYTFWRRSVGPPTLFDTSARQVCTVRQLRTNTPLHALTLLNDVTYVEAARAFAQRMMIEGGAAPQDRIAWAFRTATGRRPQPAEQAVLLAGFERTVSQYRADRKAAEELAGAGESPRDDNLDVVELAAYTGIASVLLNLDEVVTKE